MAILGGILETSTSKVGIAAIATLSLALAWLLSSAIYNLFYHPLHSFPGPILSRASSLPWATLHVLGKQAFYTAKLHEQYGSVVRIGPNHLSFTDPRAWKDIYGHRVGTGKDMVEMSKSPATSHPIADIPKNIANADREEHARLRRAMSHGFSDSSIRTQGPVIAKYVDKLVQGLRQKCRDENGQEKAVNIEAWLNWTTFDIVGDLVFGLSFNCLEKFEYHPWVFFMLKSIEFGAYMGALYYIGLEIVVLAFFRTLGSSGMKELNGYTDDMVKSRLNMKTERDDLFEGIIKKHKEWGMSFEQLSGNALILVLAGSETSATLLSGCTYLLLTHPDKMEKLKKEVRSAFADDSEINANSVNQLSYMLAVLNECLRLYPPVASTMVRIVPAGGEVIAGHYVAGGALVEVQPWSINHSKDCWNDPWEFRPERFIDKEPGDILDSMQAFSVGPRNCLGRNLAYVEMRLILARLIYNFDFKLTGSSNDWIGRQKAFGLWQMIPLDVYLTPVR